MTPRRSRAALLAATIVALPLALSPIDAPPAQALFGFGGFGGIVFDPTNYAQNVLQAARALQQINNQITALQNQAQMLINQARILLKPTRPDLTTNLVINTDRRTYHLELHSTETTYMASVSWQYPGDQLIALRRQNAAALAARPIAGGVDLRALHFRYEIEGDHPPWRPLRAFDDGRRVFIEFPRGIGQGEMPPLFVIGPTGRTSELVNYRVRDNYMIVDSLFAAAELRYGSGNRQQEVRIARTDDRSSSGGRKP